MEKTNPRSKSKFESDWEYETSDVFCAICHINYGCHTLDQLKICFRNAKLALLEEKEAHQKTAKQFVDMQAYAQFLEKKYNHPKIDVDKIKKNK
jgi:hypothetical protein